MKSPLRARAVFALVLAALAFSGVAHAQTSSWPSKPVRLVVPFAAAGSTDLIARYLADGLTTRLGQQVIVDNRSGASGNIGTDVVAKAPADGYTIGLVTFGPLVNNKFLFKKMPFDATHDLTPIAMVCEIPLIIATSPDKVPAKTLRDFVAAARANPAAYTIATPGNGTVAHLAVVAMNMASKTDIPTVPYRGDAPAMADVIGGTVQAVSAPITTLLPHLSSGKLRGLAVTSSKRFPGLPDIPTAAEQGVQVSATVWIALVGPAGLPPAVVQRLNAEINRLLSDPHGQAKLQQYGAVAVTGAPDLVQRRMTSEGPQWQAVISAANITPE